MTKALLVAIDSGGTRTNMALRVGGQDLKPAITQVGDVLSGSLEPGQYAHCLRNILAPLEPYGSDAPTYVFVSAAAFTPFVRDALIDAVRSVCPTLFGGTIKAVGVANDAVTLLLGLQADGVVIAGTGSNVIIRSPEGGLYQVGGQEWVTCDNGSAFWIGLRGIRQAYRDFEAGIDSVLLQRFRELYNIRPNDDRRVLKKSRELAIADSNMKREIARFAASVCGAALRGDTEAQNIVKAEAEDLADVTAVALRRCYSSIALSGGITFVQCGSVLANEFYQSSFEAQVEMRLRSGIDKKAEIRWQHVATGLDAALNLARELQGDVDDLLELDASFRPAIIRL